MSARALAPLLLILAATGCETRLPLAYLREAASLQKYAARVDTLTGEEGPGLTEDLPPPVVFDWPSIVQRDTLRALLTFNSTGYFIHQGEPLGFEYELLQAFCQTHDLTLETVVVRDRLELFHRLNRGEGDVVAARLASTADYRSAVAVTRPLYTSRPVVVQRTSVAEAALDTPTVSEADTARTLPELGDSVLLEARLLRDPSDLGGEQVYVPRGFDFYDRIVELSDSVGQTIELIEVQRAEHVEPLIEAVAQGRIRLTVAEEDLARLSEARFTNIVATPIVGRDYATVWGVRMNAPVLHAMLDDWLGTPEASRLRDQLYVKYFVDRKAYVRRVDDELLASETGHISRYDSLLARHAKGIGWDWRLLAAQVAQESRFDPKARSWAGARGLLQLMPRTAREVGIRDPTDPEQGIAGGVRYLQWLSDLWVNEVPDAEERVKFILASYNAGRGHVLDAQRLAKKHGDDPHKWDDVAYWLLQKSKPGIYRDPVVEHGYVRGLEPVQYVSRILERWNRYREVGQD